MSVWRTPEGWYCPAAQTSALPKAKRYRAFHRLTVAGARYYVPLRSIPFQKHGIPISTWVPTAQIS